MRILIIGANGQLGSDLLKIFSTSSEEVIPLTHRDIEICDHKQTRRILTSYSPDVVINTAAYHRTDECEENIQKAFQVNTFAVRNLAIVCKDVGSILIHFSTDYVFGGDKRVPYVEEDLPNPLNVYGASKLVGEYFVRNIWAKHFIIRTSGLYGVAGSSGKGGNFVELMLKLAKEQRPIKVVNDQTLSPTYTRELAAKVAELIRTEEYGLYHITNNGECSWYEFAKAIFELCGLSPELSPVTSKEFRAKALRPKYSVLDNLKLRKLNLDNMRHWRDALKEYLSEKGHLEP